MMNKVYVFKEIITNIKNKDYLNNYKLILKFIWVFFKNDFMTLLLYDFIKILRYFFISY